MHVQCSFFLNIPIYKQIKSQSKIIEAVIFSKFKGQPFSRRTFQSKQSLNLRQFIKANFTHIP